MEAESMRFYQAAAKRTTNLALRKLLDELPLAEQLHLDRGQTPQGIGRVRREKRRGSNPSADVCSSDHSTLLAGLMDGSVSTLAPVFAAAFATRDSWDAFLIGMAASIAAGISMGFAEALSDDGVLSGRGSPFIRGRVCGLMTTMGGVGHTLPFLITNFHLAMLIAVVVVALELAAISSIRHQYMDTPLLAAAFQVVVGGVLVFLTGILIGSA